MSRKNKRKKEEICEDFCFSCKDGGLLIICDYKDCLKAYHPECVEKDKEFLDSGERWNCKWHSCFICQRLSKFYCLCCPRAVCGRCIYDAEFVLVKQEKGLCQNCLKLASLIEDGLPVDSDGVTVDFKDEKTSEFFFVGYWEYIKEKEGLNKESIRSANEILKKGKNYRSDPYFLEIGKIEENVGESEEESHRVVSDYDDLVEVDEYKPRKKKSKKSKRNSRETNKREKSKKKEFDGWGTKSLLGFLESVDQDTSKPMGEYEVASVVLKYCVTNKLFDPQKKKRIICDEMLCSLFGKKFVLKNSLNKLLAVHFASNFEQSVGDDRLWSSSDDGDVNINVTRRKSPGSPRQTQKEKVNPEVRKSRYALVNTDNIKLVYLKRSLVEELLKQREEFDKKVVGSFVRVKCNPNDYLQKNSHQLLHVKGVTASRNGQIILKFSDCPEDFPVCKLSDENFTEEECEDLRCRIKDGLLKKPTVVELEQKARSLHKDIINHWIPKELDLLRRRIDHANEKGWRREMSEYMDRIQLLSDESERQRLLDEFPEIIAEPIVQDMERDDRDGLRSASPHFPDSDFGDDNFSYQSETKDENNQSVTSAPANEKAREECYVLAPEVGVNALEGSTHHRSVSEINASCCKTLFPEESPQKQKIQASTSEGQTYMNVQPQLQSRSNQQATMENESTSKAEVIQLSDDEPEEDKVGTRFTQPVKDIDPSETRDLKSQHRGFALKESPRKTLNAELFQDTSVAKQYRKFETRFTQPVKDIETRDSKSQPKGSASKETPRASNAKLFQDTSVAKQYRMAEIGRRSLGDAESSLWYCRSALGHKAGPFKMSSLKSCFETRDQELEIKVWKKGWSEDDAILMEDAIRRLFPGT